jgi:hypothetical protein
LPELNVDDPVALYNRRKRLLKRERVLKKLPFRSYVVQTNRRVFQRNRKDLRISKVGLPQEEVISDMDFFDSDLSAPSSLEQANPPVSVSVSEEVPEAAVRRSARANDYIVHL